MFVATIGFFDGVHLGHQCLLSQVREVARARALRSLAVTFEGHPRQVVCPDFVPSLLTTTQEKRSLLTGAVDELRVLPFTRELSLLSAREFLIRMREDMGVSALVMGYDHRFGHDGASVRDWGALGREACVEVIVARELEGLKASSSEARRLLAEGDVEGASRVLGRCYELGGVVVHGQAIGRALGFPTANVSVDEGKLLPARGVYAVRVSAGGREYKGMLNIGCRPTVGEGMAQSVEAHLFGFEGDLYGERIAMQLVARLRPERRFATMEELSAQLRLDAERASQ